MSKCKNNPGRDLMGILFSDYKLIDCIYDLYDKVISEDINHCSILLEENGELIRERFDFICAIIYARYIISLLLGVSSIDLTGDFESLRFDLYLLKIYRTFSVTILNSIYRNLSIFEFSMFSNLEILNDICIYAPVFATKKKFELASKITSMFAGDAGHKNHDAIINKIIKIVNKKLDNGCKDTHAQMLKHFKNSAEFGGYFEKKSENRGFERALRKAIIETYQQRGLPIAGTRGVSVSHSSKNDNKPFKYMYSFYWDE